MVQGPGSGAHGPAHGHGHHAHEHGPHEHAHQHEHGEPAGEAPHDHHGFVAAAAAIGAQDRRRRGWRLLSALVLAGAAATLCAEVGLRLAGVRAAAFERDLRHPGRRWLALSRAGLLEARGDARLGYGFRPLAEAELDGRAVRVSTRGTLGAEPTATKADGEARLLVLGDALYERSSDEALAFAAQLAACANAAQLTPGRTWSAFDLGLPGYHLGQSRILLEESGFALEPDLVVLCTGPDDLEQTGYVYDQALGVLARDHLPLPRALRLGLWRWSHLYGWIASAHARALADVEQPTLDARLPFAHVRADNQAFFRAELVALAQACARRGVPLFVLHVPSAADAARPDGPQAFTRAALEELGLPAMFLETDEPPATAGPTDTLAQRTCAGLGAAGLLP